MSEIQRQYYTITEAAHYLETSREMVNKLVAHLGIRYIKMSSTLKNKIHIYDVKKMEDELESKSTDNPFRLYEF